MAVLHLRVQPEPLPPFSPTPLSQLSHKQHTNSTACAVPTPALATFTRPVTQRNWELSSAQTEDRELAHAQTVHVCDAHGTLFCCSPETRTHLCTHTHTRHMHMWRPYRYTTITPTHTHTDIWTHRRGFEGLLWIMPVYTCIHSGLFGCQTSSECADYKAECLSFSRVMSCVLCFLIVESKEGLIMSEIVFLFLLTLHLQVMDEKPPSVV